MNKFSFLLDELYIFCVDGKTKNTKKVLMQRGAVNETWRYLLC